MDVVQKYGWKEPETLEKLFYLLQEKAVIDSDLVDQMIAMYRLRWDLIEEKIEQGDYKLVDEIMGLNLEDINLYFTQVKEYNRAREIKEFRNTSIYEFEYKSQISNKKSSLGRSSQRRRFARRIITIIFTK